ncbi:PDZ and LIM domain protein Zasp [Caerostris extrusa]|uniref:PDZ and LIM domain protein Zasp n=1 Tax=Caerostris extrusa TaxID=172846 RepID=A0AAV4MPQ3_CAEEX|nr:PDZ and LIM domain protein Zasp [Caerostris extrusa]
MLNLNCRAPEGRQSRKMETFSMNVIAQTLSQHSEMLAPGVMGINFMKPEKPINTMSEVYKLVQEEEQCKVRSPTPGGCTSPPIFRPSKIPPSVPAKPQAPPAPAPVSAPPAPAPVALKKTAPAPEGPSQGPCSDCGRIIVILHQECFNCSTCGASLKNTGFHNINNKLYCDTHAKLAARVIASQVASAAAPAFAPAPAASQPAPAPFAPPKPVQAPVIPPLPTTPIASAPTPLAPQPAVAPPKLPTTSIPQPTPTPFNLMNLPQSPSSSGNLAFRSISPQPFKRRSGEYHRVNAPTSPTPGPPLLPLQLTPLDHYLSR